jgi:DNA-binding NarL/FixJ family response regulator
VTASDAPEPEVAAPGTPIRVVVSDDHPVVRQGLRSFLEAEGFAVVGEADDGAAAVEVVRRERPDVLLTDLVMPGVDGIEAIRRLRADGPPVGILVLTSFSGADQVIPAIQAGADGYLLKDAGPAALEAAIRAVHRGEPLLAPEAAAVVMARVAGESTAPEADATTASPADHPDLDRLTAREREVLAGLGRGVSNRQLAAELFVAEKTVKTHVSSVLAKLRLADRTQAALYAVRVGLVDPRR